MGKAPHVLHLHGFPLTLEELPLSVYQYLLRGGKPKAVYTFRATNGKIHVFAEYSSVPEADAGRGLSPGGWQGEPCHSKIHPMYLAVRSSGRAGPSSYFWDGQGAIAPKIWPSPPSGPGPAPSPSSGRVFPERSGAVRNSENHNETAIASGSRQNATALPPTGPRASKPEWTSAKPPSGPRRKGPAPTAGAGARNNHGHDSSTGGIRGAVRSDDGSSSHDSIRVGAESGWNSRREAGRRSPRSSDRDHDAWKRRADDPGPWLKNGEKLSSMAERRGRDERAPSDRDSSEGQQDSRVEPMVQRWGGDVPAFSDDRYGPLRSLSLSGHDFPAGGTSQGKRKSESERSDDETRKKPRTSDDSLPLDHRNLERGSSGPNDDTLSLALSRSTTLVAASNAGEPVSDEMGSTVAIDFEVVQRILDEVQSEIDTNKAPMDAFEPPLVEAGITQADKRSSSHLQGTPSREPFVASPPSLAENEQQPPHDQRSSCLSTPTSSTLRPNFFNETELELKKEIAIHLQNIERLQTLYRASQADLTAERAAKRQAEDDAEDERRQRRALEDELWALRAKSKTQSMG